MIIVPYSFASLPGYAPLASWLRSLLLLTRGTGDLYLDYGNETERANASPSTLSPVLYRRLSMSAYIAYILIGLRDTFRTARRTSIAG